MILKYFIENDERAFTIIPNRKSFVINHIKIDTNSLYKSLRKYGIIKSTEKRFIEQKDIHWRKLFNVDKWETVNRKFN